MLTIKQAGDHVIGAIRPILDREVVLYVESLSNVQVAELLSAEYHLIAVALADSAQQSIGWLRSYLIDFLQATIAERLHLQSQGKDKSAS